MGQGECAVLVGREGDDRDDGVGIQWAVDVGEGFLRCDATSICLYEVVADFRGYLSGIDAQEHQVGLAPEEEISGHENLQGVGAVYKALGVDGCGAIAAGSSGLLPLIAVNYVVEVAHAAER